MCETVKGGRIRLWLCCLEEHLEGVEGGAHVYTTDTTYGACEGVKEEIILEEEGGEGGGHHALMCVCV